MSSQDTTALRQSTVAALDSLDSYWATVDSAREQHGMTALAEKPAAGLTAREYMQRYSLRTMEAAHDQLRRLEARGALERVMVMLPDARGHVKPMSVWVPCHR